jgi:hypothetical protein
LKAAAVLGWSMLQMLQRVVASVAVQIGQGGKWPTGLRPRPPRGRAVATVRRPWPHRSGPSGLLERHDAASASLPPLSLSRPVLAERKKPSRLRRRALRRRRVRSPSHHRPIHHAHSSATTSRTSSNPPLEQPSRVRAHCRLFPRSELTGAPPACGACTRPCSSTLPRSSIGISLGPPWLWEANAHLR